MPSATQSSRLIDSKAIPYALGAALAGTLFALFGLDLWHPWVPYSPHKPPSFVAKFIPWFVWLAAAFASMAAAFASTGLQWLRQRRSRSWPWAASTIEHSSIGTAPTGEGSSYLLTVAYSYSVNGERYGGVYAEAFDGEPEAQAVRNSLKSFPPPVRYQPGDPFKSLMDPYRDAHLTVGPSP
jgi:hypothetical protein